MNEIAFCADSNPDGANLSARANRPQSSSAEIFELHFMLWKHTRRMTNSGNAFRPVTKHGELERVSMTHAVFDQEEDVVNCRPQNFLTLELPFLTLGKWTKPWPRSATGSLVSTVSNLNLLEKISLADSHSFYSDLEGPLSDLSTCMGLDLSIWKAALVI